MTAPSFYKEYHRMAHGKPRAAITFAAELVALASLWFVILFGVIALCP